MVANNQNDAEPAEDAKKLAEEKEGNEAEDDEAQAEEKPQPEAEMKKLDNVYEATKMKVKPVAHAEAAKAKPAPRLTAPFHNNKAELPDAQEEEDRQEEEADRKEAEENPLRPEVVPAQKVMAKKAPQAEQEEPTPTEQTEQG
jgi:hypothetical protein